MISRISIAASVVVAVAASGCLLPKSAYTGAEDSGEQLSFRAHRNRYKVKEREVVGETDYYDASGDYAGTAERTRLVEKTKLGEREVYFYQGAKRIGEADFYKIGGDLEAARMADDKQSKLWWLNAGSYGLMGGGAAVSVAAVAGAFGEENGRSIGYVASALAISGGGLLWRYVFSRRKDARMPLERAQAVVAPR